MNIEAALLFLLMAYIALGILSFVIILLSFVAEFVSFCFEKIKT